MPDDAEQPSRRELPPAVQVKFRCREDLKLKIDAAALEHEVSLSAEINDRLNFTFEEDRRRLTDATILGGKYNVNILKGLAAILSLSSASAEDFSSDVYRTALKLSINKLLDGLIPSPDLQQLRSEDDERLQEELSRLSIIVDMCLKRGLM